jgi:GH15 family glucan-1,4-alpha-glucosidase
VRTWPNEDGTRLVAVAGPDAVWLNSSVSVADRDGALTSRFRLTAGDCASFVLTYQPSHLERPKDAEPENSLRDTELFWHDWMTKCTYTGRWAPEVRRALILLKALTFAPTGGIVAAATTSLPEELSGVRNWDYRFCWLRDATFTLQALLGTGYVDEAKAWREWLVRAVAGDPSKLQIMYGLDGSRRLPEFEVPWLSGFSGSAPVRIGNLAADQLQLDVWGEVLDGLHLSREAGLEYFDPAWEVQRGILDWLEGNWDEPDNGLWEMRGPRRPFVHSKVMAWAGVDRAVHSVEEHGLDGPIDRWRSLRDHIHDEVCREGYDADRGTFTQFYGSQGLDASLLLLPRVGFLPWTDERSIGTVEAVQRELMRDGFLLRYDPHADGGPDGLPGGEGAFLACSFWLVDSLQAIGRKQEAVELFERLLALRNDVGMLSEEVDPGSGKHLGNTPQAFSLVGLVNCARSLEGSHPSTNASGAEQKVGASRQA